MAETIEVVTLKNGTEEARPLIGVMMLTLQRLWAEKPTVLYELVQLCRDREHELWGSTSEDLLALSLIEKTNDGFRVHDSIRNIVLSAIEGEGLEMKLGNPVAAQPKLTEPVADEGE